MKNLFVLFLLTKLSLQISNQLDFERKNCKEWKIKFINLEKESHNDIYAYQSKIKNFEEIIFGLNKQLGNLTQENKSLKQNFYQLQQNDNNYRMNIEGLQMEIDKYEHRFTETMKEKKRFEELSKVIQNQKNIETEEILLLTTEVKNLQIEISVGKKQNQDLIEQNSSYQSELQNLNSIISEFDALKQEYKQKLDMLNNNLGKTNVELNIKIKDNQNYQDKFVKLNADLENLRRSNNVLASENQKLKMERENLKQQKQSIMNELDVIKANFISYEQTLNHYKSQNHQLSLSINQLQQNNNDILNQLKNYKQLKKEHEQYSYDIEDLRHSISLLEADKEHLHENNQTLLQEQEEWGRNYSNMQTQIQQLNNAYEQCVENSEHIKETSNQILIGSSLKSDF